MLKIYVKSLNNEYNGLTFDDVTIQLTSKKKSVKINKKYGRKRNGIYKGKMSILRERGRSKEWKKQYGQTEIVMPESGVYA